MNAHRDVDSAYLRSGSSLEEIISMVFALGLVISGGILSIWRLDSWHATPMDMGWYCQALWLIGHGHWKAFDTIVGYPALTDSMSYVLYPLGLVYRIVGQVGILILQTLAMGSGLLAIGYYAKRYHMTLPNRIAWMALYAVYPAVLGPELFDWHPDVLIIPALFLSIWALEQNRWKYFIIGSVVAACTKDVGAGVVAVDFLIVLPWLAPYGSPVWQATYGWLGATIGTAITNLLKHPHLILWA